jgi:hypothetical protein
MAKIKMTVDVEEYRSDGQTASGTVAVQIDGPIEFMRTRVSVPDLRDEQKNRLELIARARQCALIFAREPVADKADDGE